MREAGGGQRSGAIWLLGFSMLTSLASACSEAGDGRSADEGTGGNAAAATGGIGPAPAGTGGIPANSAMHAATGGAGGNVSLDAGKVGGTGGASPIVDAGAQTDAAVDAGLTDAGSMPDGMDYTAVCMGGTVGKDSDSEQAPALNVAREFAAVKFLAKTPNQILDMKTTVQVTKPPTSMQTLFIWPGLQSRDGAADPARVGNGVLQPVLTWGGSCAPKLPPDIYSGWWMSGMYVNVSSGVAGPGGCAGGDYVTTELGDLLDIDMAVDGTNWIQTITNTRTMKTVDFTIDLKGQVQNNAMWVIEVPSGETIRPSEDVVFTQNVLTFSDPVTSCQPSQAGGADYYSAPVLSPDGLHCCFDKIILRAMRN